MADPRGFVTSNMRFRCAGGVAMLLIGGSVLSGTPAESVSSTVVALPYNTSVLQVEGAARADLSSSVVTASTGQAVLARSVDGQGRAIDFPSRYATNAGRLAIQRIVDTDLRNGDALSPGTSDFTLAADFRLDGGTAPDPGNNLVQRGTWGSSHQMKLQVDLINGVPRPECMLGQTISGRFVYARASLPRAIAFGRWYRMVCRRTGTTLTLAVHSIGADGRITLLARHRISTPTVFDLTWPPSSTAPVPFTVGGKLWPNGQIDPDDDQFNGLVDNVRLTIG